MSYVYITEQGTCISKESHKFIVSKAGQKVFEIPGETLEGLILAGSVQLSSQAVLALLKKDIPVTWISQTGEYYGRLEPPGHVHVAKQEKQILVRQGDFPLAMGKKIIQAKVHNQVTLLQRYNRRLSSKKVQACVEVILSQARRISNADSRDMLMGFEGIIAKNYFEALGVLVPAEFSFTKRSRRPPLDPFNALLSLGYTLVFREMYTAVASEGLHPYFGFLHALKNHHPALVSDLMEEWRTPIVDSLVLYLIQRKEIKTEHFTKAPGGKGIFLTKEGWKIFLTAYEKKMQTDNTYMEGDATYRQSLRSQAQRYSQALMKEDVNRYEALWIR